ncbi:SDR family NAD(P)-dependent oxidoreductase [Paenibacillaceae bacterium WGS1546]|uniref:SDR family NAD(P)-dependent oxidoreductase n=1 Tax=Cohnella sp. WGS1546 TaxID=3366810 RepID=UPI00372CF64B
MQFANQVVLVTGSGNGIGRSIALGFAREGAQVVVADLDGAAAKTVCDGIRRSGGRAVWHQTDVSSADQVEELFAKILEEFGVLDVLINNVGSTIRKPIMDFTEEEWDFVFDTNIKSMFLCARQAGGLMLKRRSGAVVNISSVHGLGGISKRLPYSTSKSAVESFTKTLACEWALDGVRVNCVSPGYIMTDNIRETFAQGILNLDDMVRRTPQARLGTPEDIAEAVLFLCSDRASFITGSVLQVDGGYSAYHGPEPVPSFHHNLD